MIRLLRSAAAALLVVTIANAAVAAPLDEQVEQMIAQGPAKRAIWGIYAIELGSDKVIADVNGQRLLTPASTRKLVSTAMVASAFKGDDKLVTVLRADEEVDRNGTITGDLTLIATGDPSWSPEFLGGRPGQAKLSEIAKEAAAAGLKRVEGDLVIATGRYGVAEPIPPGWAWDELSASYAPRPSVLAINQNLVGITIKPGRAGQPVTVEFATSAEPFEIINNSRTLGGGSAPTLSVERQIDGRTITIDGGLPVDASPGARSIPAGNPVEMAADVLREKLEAEGVTITGGIRFDDSVPKGGVVIADAEGATMADIMKVCNRESDNYLAESLYLLATMKLAGSASYSGAHQIEAKFWKRLGIGMDEINAADGSGLSRETSLTPHALATLLREYRKVDWFVDSLPVSGKSGTLRYRLSDKGMAGRVIAKTGTLDGGSALAGYVKTNSGKYVAFSIMANNYTGGTPSIRKKIDDIVILLAQR